MAIPIEVRAKAEELISKSANLIRGKILQLAVEIESAIDIYLGEHFTNDITKQEELICLILAPRISFENKAQVFKVIVEKYNPEYKEWNKNYFSELKDIIEDRNVFAHYPVSFSEKAILDFNKNDVVTFAKLKNESFEGKVSLYNERPMKEDDVNVILKLMDNHIITLRLLISNGTAPTPKP